MANKTIFSEEHKQNIAAGLKGKKHTEERKANMREAWKRRKARSQKTTNEQV